MKNTRQPSFPSNYCFVFRRETLPLLSIPIIFYVFYYLVVLPLGAIYLSLPLKEVDHPFLHTIFSVGYGFVLMYVFHSYGNKWNALMIVKFIGYVVVFSSCRLGSQAIAGLFYKTIYPFWDAILVSIIILLVGLAFVIIEPVYKNKSQE